MPFDDRDLWWSMPPDTLRLGDPRFEVPPLANPLTPRGQASGAPPPSVPPTRDPESSLEWLGTPLPPPERPGPRPPFRGGDSLIDRAFLGALRYLQPHGGTPGRWYNQVIQEGRTNPFTERDLSPGDDDALRAIVLAHSRANSGARSGTILPGNYGATRITNASPLRNALGGFSYRIADDGTINITDTYDFNVDRGPRAHDMGVGGKLAAIALGPVAYGAAIGRSVVGSDSGRGVPINLTLPPPVPFEDYVDAPSRRPTSTGGAPANYRALRTYEFLQMLGADAAGLGLEGLGWWAGTIE